MTQKTIEYLELDTYSPSSLIVTVKFPKSVAQFDGFSYNCLSLDINLAKEGPPLSMVVV